MPWKEVPVSELRLAFVKLVRSLNTPIAEACRRFGISRKTGYKWLRRGDEESPQPFQDRSRRPRRSPRQTTPAIEEAVLAVRDRYGWGRRKIRAYLLERGQAVPSARTVNQILRRHGRLRPAATTSPTPIQTFERTRPNELWQLDFKGPVEVARQRVFPLSILDDHSRFLLNLRVCLDLTMRSAWTVLWDTFAQFGLPEAILCDNAFGSRGPGGLSWFEAHLLRLGIHTCHGKPYHPQTQGKVKRFHGTLEREVWSVVRRDCLEHFQQDLDCWRTETYNLVRPHEALNDQPPLRRWQPSVRPRPAALPEVTYPAGSVLRRVGQPGDVYWSGYRIMVGAGLTGERVRIQDTDTELRVLYATKVIRSLPHVALVKGPML